MSLVFLKLNLNFQTTQDQFSVSQNYSNPITNYHYTFISLQAFSTLSLLSPVSLVFMLLVGFCILPTIIGLMSSFSPLFNAFSEPSFMAQWERAIKSSDIYYPFIIFLLLPFWCIMRAILFSIFPVIITVYIIIIFYLQCINSFSK